MSAAHRRTAADDHAPALTAPVAACAGEGGRFRRPRLGHFVALHTKQVDLVQLTSDTSLSRVA
jgi:hypothetical protein